MERIRAAGLYITRRCNNDCAWCGLARQSRRELPLSMWHRALSVMSAIGIDTVKILGGEPTLYDRLDELVRFVTQDLQMACTVVSNLLVGPQSIERLARAGLTSISTSIDTIGGNAPNKGSERKSRVALEKLAFLKAQGISVVVNIVLNASNLCEIVDMVDYFSEMRVHTHIIPFHHGDPRVHPARLEGTETAITRDSKPLVVQVVEQLLARKRMGALIQESEKYLRDLPKYLFDMNWHCGALGHPCLLRLDCDGTPMACSDFYGENSSRLTVFDLELQDRYRKWSTVDWLSDVGRCEGCIWPDMYHAELPHNVDHLRVVYGAPPSSSSTV